MADTQDVGRKKLNRDPFNSTLPKPLADAVRLQAESEQRPHSLLVEDALRAYLRKVGRDIVLPVAKRKGGTK